MTDSRAGLRSGSFAVQAQERVVFGESAESAARAEAERYSAQRVFVISTRSLDRVADGPLQRIVAALEARHVGTFAVAEPRSRRGTGALSYCSPLASPATEPLSLQGLRLLGRALQNIKATSHDLAARLEAQFGMWQAILPGASGVSIGASHGIGYVLGGTFGVAHGHTSCVMLPAVLRWNAVVNADRQRALAEA